jgi:hypothetical protein
MWADDREEYDYRMREMTRRVVNQFDFSFDKCNTDNTYNSKIHICTDPDNPLFYIQTEFLVDVLNGNVPEVPYDYTGYFPPLEQIEFTCLHTNKIDSLSFNITEWTMDTHMFWSGWVRNEMMANISLKFKGIQKYDEVSEKITEWQGNDQGANTFAQNLIWWRHQHDNNRLKTHERFFIAFISNTDTTLSTQNIFMAVGVFVHEGCLYSTMGITKSFRLSVYDTDESNKYMQISGFAESQIEQQTIDFRTANKDLKRASIKLQSFIADFIQEKHSTVHGIFFRPNHLMRNFVRVYFPDYDLGSDKDILNAKDPRVAKAYTDVQLDDPPKIIQLESDEVIKIRDKTFPTPFWEPPSQNAHPDYWLNRHIPLMYVPVAQMKTPVTENESKYTRMLRAVFRRDGDWRTVLLRKLKNLKPSKNYWTLFHASDLLCQDNMIQQILVLIKDVLGIEPQIEVYGSRDPDKYIFTYNGHVHNLKITDTECKIK